MSGMSRTSDGLDARRKKALFRAWHRGTREMDLVFGRFADAEIAALDEGELAAFEALMEEADAESFKWVTGAAVVPTEHDTPLFARVRRYGAIV
ncbi:MAG: succinate dehydrogenase assembly factor 2 [Phyllobacteriaceae bacterium]|nr:succinate dehydrogenase assembly factor 2 [Phyllobacteriaceae bacterium]